MKLFISYSREDKAWSYELWRALRDRAFHDAWIDQQVAAGQDWWDTILQSIGDCDCCVYIMTPASVASIYCPVEVDYALALNKPIVPLMLKPCDYPSSLTDRRIQYQTVQDGMSLGDVLFIVEHALGEIRESKAQGKYQAPQTLPLRPNEPKPEKKAEQASELFGLAEAAESANNPPLAEKFYQQVIDADPQGYGLDAAERLRIIRNELASDLNESDNESADRPLAPVPVPPPASRSGRSLLFRPGWPIAVVASVLVFLFVVLFAVTPQETRNEWLMSLGLLPTQPGTPNTTTITSPVNLSRVESPLTVTGTYDPAGLGASELWLAVGRPGEYPYPQVAGCDPVRSAIIADPSNGAWSAEIELDTGAGPIQFYEIYLYITDSARSPDFERLVNSQCANRPQDLRNPGSYQVTELAKRLISVSG